MISYIEIKDFAVVKDLKLDLFPGLNVITGETGAGKSVIIEAVSMALGARADSDYVRTGAEKAVITLVADPGELDISSELEEMGAPGDIPVIIKREISAAGRSMCRVNGMPVPLSLLSKLCKRLADIHGQYDQQSLLDASNHINILDLYGGKSLKSVKKMVQEIYRSYAAVSSELMALNRKTAQSARQKEILEFEVSEIDSADLKPNEDEELEERIGIMQNSGSILSALTDAHEKLFGGDYSAVSLLGSAMSQIQGISEYSSDLSALCDRVSSAYYELEDTSSQLRALRDSVSFSPEELEEAEDRLELINSLKRKFGGSIEDILQYAEKARTSLSEIENSEETVKDLEKKISYYRQQYDLAAQRLSALRRQTADQLKERVDRELSELNFKNARFDASFVRTGVTENGTDSVEFMISANAGEELRPLAKVASGGELSRIMLALKRITGEVDGIPTMIFDEIDTGISGATAGVVGEKLRSIAKTHQIICITHLPQIAARAEHHFRIEKHSDGISTQTTVVPLSEEERIEEVARLMSGTAVTDSARAAARELIEQ